MGYVGLSCPSGLVSCTFCGGCVASYGLASYGALGLPCPTGPARCRRPNSAQNWPCEARFSLLGPAPYGLDPYGYSPLGPVRRTFRWPLGSLLATPWLDLGVALFGSRLSPYGLDPYGSPRLELRAAIFGGRLDPHGLDPSGSSPTGPGGRTFRWPLGSLQLGSFWL